MTKKALYTQRIVNAFPSWANVRQDEQSLGYQVANVSGKLLDDLHKQVSKIGDNYFLSTACISDIGQYYYLDLPGDYEFIKEDNDDTELLYTPPVVSGQAGDPYYGITLAHNNNIENFWYLTVPDRLSLGAIVSGEHVLAQGYASEGSLELTTPSGELHIPNYVYVTMEGGQRYLSVTDSNMLLRSLVQLEGVTRAGLEVVDNLYFLHDNQLRSTYEFDHLTDIRVYGPGNPEETNVFVTSANFNTVDYPSNYQDMAMTVGKEPMPLFWRVSSGLQVNTTTLDLVKYDAEDIELRLQGFVQKSPVVQMELLDADLDPVPVVDIAIEPHSDRIWAVTSGVVYIYNTDIPYPDMSKLHGKQYDAPSVIEPSSYWVIVGEEVEINYIWRRPTQSFVRHRAWVTKPDGTKRSLEEGMEVPYHTDNTSWIFGEPHGRAIRPSEVFTLDQRGDYVFSLECFYGDDTSSVDKRIVSTLYKTPEASFSLWDLGFRVPIVGIDIDSEYKIWLLDSNNFKHEITPHYDKMIIDFKRKRIYFRERYDQIKVEGYDI